MPLVPLVPDCRVQVKVRITDYADEGISRTELSAARVIRAIRAIRLISDSDNLREGLSGMFEPAMECGLAGE